MTTSADRLDEEFRRLLIAIFMDRATRRGTRNRICWDARTERIQREEQNETNKL